MRNKIFIILILTVGSNQICNAQILEKLKDKINKVATEVTKEINKVPCLISDKDCIEKAQKEGKEVIYTEENNQPIVGNTSSNSNVTNTSILNDENNFSSTTKQEIFKTGNKEFKVSKNGKAIAHLDFEGSRKVLKINGTPDPIPDNIYFDLFEFSPSGKRYAYIAQFGSECKVVIDGKRGQSVDCPSRGSTYYRFRGKPMFYFTQDDSKLAYFYPKSRLLGINYNGKNMPGLISNSAMAQQKEPIIVRGNKVFFTLYEGDITNLFINGEIQGSYRDLIYLEVSNDGNHYAYAARTYNPEEDTKQEMIIIDGKEFPIENSNLRYSNFDKNNGMVTYWDSNKGFMVNGELAIRKDDRRFSAEGLFSKNGQNRAFVINRSDIRQKQVIFNGKEMPPFEDIKEISFSGDGKSLVYIGSNGGKHFVMVDGLEIGPFDSVQDLVLSEEGNSYAFKARTGSRENLFWYVNGKKIAMAMGPIVFSKDGSRYAFLSSAEGDYNSPHAWIIDGELHTGRIGAFFSKDQTSQPSNNFVFNPVNNNLAYVIKDNYDQGLWRDVVMYGDKKLTGIEQSTRFYKPIFSDDGENMSLFMRNNVSSQSPLIKLFINMKPGPILGQPKARTGNYPFEFADFLDNKTFRTVGLEGEKLEVFTISI